MEGDGHPRPERPLRDRDGGELRSAGRGEDRHDGQPCRRLVLRLHARPDDGRLDGVSGRRDPDGERARDRRHRGQLPRRDVAAVHEAGARGGPGTRLPRAEAVPGLPLLPPRRSRLPRVPPVAAAGSDDDPGDDDARADQAGEAGATALRRRATLAAGLGAFVLTAAATALGWVDDAPLVPVGGRLVGDRDWSRLFLALLAVAFALYVVALRSVRRLPVAYVAALAAAIQLAPLAAPVLLSSDVWTYWDYGRIAAVDGGNPYRSGPDEFPGDPALPYTGTAWRDTTTVYGPAFTLASEPLARAAGSSADAAAWIYKSIAAAAILGAAALAARLSRRPAYALAFVGW